MKIRVKYDDGSGRTSNWYRFDTTPQRVTFAANLFKFVLATCIRGPHYLETINLKFQVDEEKLTKDHLF